MWTYIDTNSVLWLIGKYGIPTDKLPKKPDGSLDQQAILTQLAAAMQSHNTTSPNNWDPTTPVNNNNRGYPGLDRGSLEAGKMDFIRNNMLPLSVEGGVNDPNAQGAKAFDFVKKELQ